MSKTNSRQKSVPTIELLAAQLSDLANRLTTLLSQETALIRAMRVKEIGPLQAEKTALTTQYQAAFTTFTASHNGMTLSTPLREMLAVAGKNLAAAVIDNELALRVGKTATERLISSIVAAVKEQNKSITAYAPTPVAPRRSFMTAAAIDRQL